MIFYFTYLCPCFDLVRNGARAKNYYQYIAGRRGLAPLLMLLGYPKYGRLVLWDTIRTDATCQKDIKQFLTEAFAFKGQGLDFDQEEVVKHQTAARIWKAKTE